MDEMVAAQARLAAGTVVEDGQPTRGKYSSVINPVKLPGAPSAGTRSRCTRGGTRAPLLGEHTDEILRQVLGFSDHQVAEIHDSGALEPPRKQAAAKPKPQT